MRRERASRMQGRIISRRASRLSWSRIAWLSLAVWCSGACSENDLRDPGERESNRTMRRSSGEYAKGHKDGKRDAENAIFDDSGGWLWLWMMDPEYKAGYDQGWKDGRNIARYRSQQDREAVRRESRPKDTTAGPKPTPPTVETSEPKSGGDE